MPRSAPRRPARLIGRAAALAVSLAATGTMLLPLASPAAAASSGEPARSVADFLDSIGVNVHMGYGSTRYADAPATLEALRRLGIAHVRENIHISNSAAMTRLKTLRDGGIRFDFIVPRPDEVNGADPTPTVDAIAKDFAGSTDAIEGPNEYDNTQQADWVTNLRNSQHDLAPAAARQPDLADAMIFGPSLINFRLKEEAPAVGDLSGALTDGNVHSYPGGQMPETEVESQVGLYQSYVSAGKPVVATETGYHNAIQSAQNSHPSTTARTAGVYYPRLFLEYFRVGVIRTYSYELFDEGTTSDQEDHFGLFAADGTAKPAALAVGNMTTILADDAPAPNDSLAYSLTDPYAGKNGSNVRHVLLQKSDGSFYLALWRAVSEATPGTGSTAPVDSSPPAQPVSLTFNQPVTSARTYLPSIGTSPQSKWQDPADITVPVGGDVTLLEVSTPGSGGPPSPTATTDAPTEAPTEAPTQAPTEAPTPGDNHGDHDGEAGNESDTDTDTDTETGDNHRDHGRDSDSGRLTPTPTASDATSPPSVGLPVLALPPLGTQNQVPIPVSGPHRIAAPQTAVRPEHQTFEVDGNALATDVLDPGSLTTGRHEVRVVGRMPDGQQLISAQLVSVARPDGHPAALLALAAALLLAQVTALWRARRRRPDRSG